jgi:hypothetical protein
MNIDLIWLFDLLFAIISHPLFISITSLIVGALITWFFFIKQINWQIMVKHFEDLKAHVIVPWLEELGENPKMGRVKDPQLFDDLQKEHYPELDVLWNDYTESQGKEDREKKALREEIHNRLESLLRRAEIEFSRDYKVVSDVCFTTHVAESIYRILEQNRWYENVLVESTPSTNFFLVKIDGTEVFRTPEENKANSVAKALDNAMKTISVDSNLHTRMNDVKELTKSTLDKKNKLTSTLRELENKAKLKLRKKLRILPRPCKYLKS